MIKRIFDIGMSVIGIVILSPLFLVIGFWIKLDSKGPVFYKQERVGHNGKLFKIFKFRTMCQNSHLLGGILTVGADPRITKSGDFLRKYKIDELSQLINVLIADMSLVGPRPEVAEYMNEYSKISRFKILSVKPGITDLASIEFKDENKILGASKNYRDTYINQIMPIKEKYYLDYVDNHSVFGDIKIIVKTFKHVFFSQR